MAQLRASAATALQRWRGSVRGRLALVNGLVVSLLLIALVAAQYLVLRHTLIDRTAALLRAQARPVIQRDLGKATPARLTIPLASRLAADLGARDSAAVVLDAQGNVLARTSDANPSNRLVPMPTPRREEIAPALSGNNEVTYQDLDPIAGHAIVALVPLRAAPPDGDVIGVVQLSTPLADVDSTLLTLIAFDTAAVAVGIGIAAVVAPVVADTALLPLRTVTQAAKAIAAGNLRQRASLRTSTDDVGQLGTAFDDMADRVEAMIAAQRRFVADASHELRTPLAVVAGGLDVLELDDPDDPAARAKLIGQLRNEVTRMGKLVQELLDLAGFDRGAAIERRDVDVAAIVRDVSDEMRLVGPRHEVIDDAPPYLFAAVDPDRIRQLLLILADNAIKYSEPGGEVRLTASRENGRLILRVSNTGAGILADALPHIFDRFFRVDKSRARAQGHFGLGLAIARSIAEAHQGTITAESTPGRGTAITVDIPVPVFDARR